ncbi:hypothetical protein DL765_006029 [Monosporascus sp. GIB2]|nr:hypothetical protein DL765_006029 [Monosporascus sp. GIB2]
MPSPKHLLSTAALFTAVHAVTPISDSTMTTWLSSGGVDLAQAAAPMWFFGQAMNRPPCYPTFATDSSGRQTPAAALCAWPDTGCNRRTPGVGISNPGPSFPVYFSFRRDWERVIVIWTKSSTTWMPSHLLLSQHSGYDRKSWSSVQNTFNTADISLPRGGDNGRKNLDHPKVYVAWSKHANYNDRNTGWNDVLSQLTNNAFRSQDWWYFPSAGDYLRADGGTALGQLLGSLGWGDANSNPPSVDAGLCSA